MRKPLLIVALLAALQVFSTGAFAQTQQNQPVPDAPQPQKKPAPKPPSSDSNPPPADQPAAKPEPSTKDANPFPEDVSRDAAKAASGDNTKPSTAKDNPFPEDVSREAAKAAGSSNADPDAKPDLPKGVSSSQSSNSSGDADDDVVDPGRAKKDIEVGGFYLKNGDLKGALLRYQDAAKVDPTNVDGIFGLAETQRMLKKNAEAAHNYQLYLDIVPNGPKAKQALKALKTLPPG